MKYFPPVEKVKKWIDNGSLRPNPIDQPMAKVKDRGYKLTDIEKERALYLLTSADVPFKEFQELPEVKAAMESIDPEKKYK